MPSCHRDLCNGYVILYDMIHNISKVDFPKSIFIYLLKFFCVSKAKKILNIVYIGHALFNLREKKGKG